MLTTFIITTCIAFTVFIGGIIYNSVLRVKAWLLDKPKPDFTEVGVAKIISIFMKPILWGFEWLFMCFLLWIGLFVLWLSYLFMWFFLVIAAIAAISGGLHFARWAIRLKKSLSKLKLSSHEHD